MSYTIKELDDILAYGPTGSKGESRELASALRAALTNLERAREALALPEVVAALNERLDARS